MSRVYRFRANNATRDAFRQAVADMFGGKNHIPDSVKDAMKLEDYGKGKPLTARRILAVKAAIDSIKTAIDSVTDTSSQAVDKTNDLIRQGKEQFKTAFLHRQGDVDRLIEGTSAKPSTRCFCRRIRSCTGRRASPWGYRRTPARSS